MSGHTPGPWRHDFMGYDSHTYYVRAEYRGRGGPNIHGGAGAIAKLPASKFHDQEANARLIAASPELLDIVISMKLAIDNGNITNASDEDTCGVLAEFAREAIAKARGETP